MHKYITWINTAYLLIAASNRRIIHTKKSKACQYEDITKTKINKNGAFLEDDVNDIYVWYECQIQYLKF